MRTLLVSLLLLPLLVVPLAPRVAAEDDAETLELRRRIAKTSVTLDVRDLSFAEVLKLLQLQTGLNIHIDPRIESDVAENPVVALHVRDLSLEAVLNLLQQTAGEAVVWFPMGHVVVFTTRDYLPRNLRVRIYPVAEHTAQRTDFMPPHGGLVGAEPAAHGPRHRQRYGGADELIELVMGAVQPSFWEETEGATIHSMDESRIVAKATAAVHAEIAAFLRRLESMEPDALRIEIQAVAASRLPARAVAEGGLSDEQVAVLLADTGAGPGLCVAARAGLQTSAFAGSRRAYVAAYDVQFAGGTSHEDPRIAAAELGMAVRLRAFAPGEDGRILLKLGVAVADAKSDTGHTSPGTSTILLPAQVTVREECTLLLEPGTWHLAGGRAGGQDAGRWAFLVRASSVRHADGPNPRDDAFKAPVPVLPGRGTALADQSVEGIAWENANLDEVLGHLRTVSGLNFFIEPRVREEVYDEVRLHLNLNEVSLGTVLDLITHPYELQWLLQDNLVTIHMRDERGARMQVRYFDLEDLVEGVVLGDVAPPDEDERTRGAAPVPLFDQAVLVDLIRESIGEGDTWEDPAAIEAQNRILIARNTPEVLDAIERTLEGLRASRSVVATTVEQVDVGPELARALFGGRAGGCTHLLDAGARASLEAALASGTATRLNRERLVSVQGSGTPRVTGEEIPYVADYDIEVSRTDDAGAPVRRVETLHSGARIALRTVPCYPSRHVYLELVFERNVLTAMEEVQTPHGPIGLPAQDVWRVRTGLRVPDGETAVVCASREGSRWRLLLVTPKRIDVD